MRRGQCYPESQNDHGCAQALPQPRPACAGFSLKAANCPPAFAVVRLVTSHGEGLRLSCVKLGARPYAIAW
jgi:hypothetical protein